MPATPVVSYILIAALNGTPLPPVTHLTFAQCRQQERIIEEQNPQISAQCVNAFTGVVTDTHKNK